MAGISFEHYLVHSSYYETNTKFYNKFIRKDSNINMIVNPSYKSLVSIKKEEALVSLTVSIDMDDNIEKTPFSLELTMVGTFTYNSDEAGGIEFEDFLKTSAIAMLFPFLRARVAELTGGSNSYPSMLLPVANVSEMMLENGDIEVQVVDEI